MPTPANKQPRCYKRNRVRGRAQHPQYLLDPAGDDEDDCHDHPQRVAIDIADGDNPHADKRHKDANQDGEREPLPEEEALNGAHKRREEQLGDLVESHRVEQKAACVIVQQGSGHSTLHVTSHAHLRFAVAIDMLPMTENRRIILNGMATCVVNPRADDNRIAMAHEMKCMPQMVVAKEKSYTVITCRRMGIDVHAHACMQRCPTHPFRQKDDQYRREHVGEPRKNIHQ